MQTLTNKTLPVLGDVNKSVITNARVIVNGIAVDIDTSPVLVTKKRYRWLPAFLIRFKWFRVEYYVPRPQNVITLKEPPPLDSSVFVMYETNL